MGPGHKRLADAVHRLFLSLDEEFGKGILDPQLPLGPPSVQSLRASEEFVTRLFDRLGRYRDECLQRKRTHGGSFAEHLRQTWELQKDILEALSHWLGADDSPF